MTLGSAIRRIMLVTSSANQLHLKFVDDLTVAESLLLRDIVTPVSITDMPQPDQYRPRTGHPLIQDKSKVLSQITVIKDFAQHNEMKLNLKKTKCILFDACTSINFLP